MINGDQYELGRDTYRKWTWASSKRT